MKPLRHIRPNVLSRRLTRHDADPGRLQPTDAVDPENPPVVPVTVVPDQIPMSTAEHDAERIDLAIARAPGGGSIAEAHATTVAGCAGQTVKSDGTTCGQ